MAFDESLLSGRAGTPARNFMLIRRADCTTLIEVQLLAVVAVPTSADEHCAMSLVRMMGQSREDNASIMQSSPLWSFEQLKGTTDRITAHITRRLTLRNGPI